jgi:hypothetical protein
MLEIFELLSCEDLNWMVEDINCCPNGTFELLYKEFEFIPTIVLTMISRILYVFLFVF